MSKSKKHEAAPAKPSSPSKSGEALASVQAEMAALASEDLAAINVDIPQVVSIALGAIPHLLPFREQLVAALPLHPIASFDRLEEYALAAYHAHILSLPAGTGENRVATLLDEATPLRETLLTDAGALAGRGLLSSDAVAAIRAGHGNIDKANDLVALSALFFSQWSTIHNKTAATEDEVRRAGELGPLLLAALGVRDHAAPIAAPNTLADQRKRSYTLFSRAYDENRRAISYLRWHEGDVDKIIPSLYKGRGGRGPAKEPAKTDDNTETGAVEPKKDSGSADAKKE